MVTSTVGLARKLSLIYKENVSLSRIYICKDKRKRVDVKTSNGVKTYQLARVLLEIKLGRKLLKNETVDHIDENKKNDDPGNLQLLSKRQNAAKTSTLRPNLDSYPGETNGQSKLTEKEVISIRKEHSSDPNKGPARKITTNFLAEKYKVSQATVKLITSRKRWVYLK